MVLDRRVGGFLALVCLFVLSLFSNAHPIQAQERPEALDGLAIQDAYTPVNFKKAGWIDRIVGEGRVVVLHRATRKAFFAVTDDPVHENDAVYTVGRIRCRIKFEDRNVVTMAPDSDLIIDEVFLDEAKGQKRSLFEVTRGKAVFYAIRLFRFRDVRLRVKTPTATVGVRGTKFGTEIERVPSRGGVPADRMTASTAPLRLAEEQGPDLLTRVFVAKGRVNVTADADGDSQGLGENEIIEAGSFGLGASRYDPTGVQAFMEGVEGPMMSGAAPLRSPSGKDTPGDRSKQHQDDMIRQLDQVEDVKQHQIEQGLEMEHPESHDHPPEHTPPPAGGEGCSTPCP